MSKRPQNNPIKAEFSRLQSASTPWWAHSFDVFTRCVALSVLPFRMAVLAAEAVVAFAFAAVIVAGYLWYTGVIPDSTVAGILSSLGERLIGIIEASGVL
ncbi:hypothetical protein G6L37_02095 [Agrobacterium rubi]|nr:hypothetical protein [Agrobacterium rubi]NTF24185.1 hypothetical protein [Agrobacterium rubi]